MQCNGLKDPSWFLMQNANGDVINPYDNEFKNSYDELPDPQIIKYAADILYRGCDRYRCRGPINKILKGLKRIIFMMQWRFIDNSRRARCGFKVKGSAWWFLGAELYFGEENIRIVRKLCLRSHGGNTHTIFFDGFFLTDVYERAGSSDSNSTKTIDF